jgi:diguanylate cyclase (GGDEF)-like protein
VLWLAPAASALFVLVQYGLVLQKYSLLGFAWLDLFKSALLPGLLAESIMVPLAMVMVLTFHSYGTVSPPFGVLVATYLIVNFIFKKMSDARSRLHEKVQDLQALNALGRSICSTLQTENLITLLGRETLTLLAEADAVMLYLWRDESTSFETFVEHRGALPSPGFSPDIARALAERTVRERQPFSTMAVGEKGALVTEAAGRVLTGRSYMGIPVEVYDQTIGVIVVFSNREAQFGASRLELLQLIGQQAAVALQNSRLYVLATVDGLTKLYVRRYFDHRLHEESARAKRYGSAFSLLLLDFDDFKGINDTHGHSTGDKVLVSVAPTILSMLRSMDVPARFGGDEFAILLPQVDLEGARVVAQRLMQRIRAERVRVGDEWLAPTVSIGVSTFPRHVAEDGPDILGAADAALYAAKNGGKSRVCVYGE